jgi:hypothetical protein
VKLYLEDVSIDRKNHKDLNPAKPPENKLLKISKLMLGS